MISIGLDISSTSTGFVALSGEPGAPAVVMDARAWMPPTGLDILDRASWQAEKLLEALSAFPPQIIVTEAFGGSQFAGGLIPVVQVGTVLRYFLRQLGHTWLEPSNSQLKKFVGCAAPGMGGKEKIAVEVFKRWGFEHKSNDVLDAYVLAQIGLASADSFCTGMSSYQADVLAAVLDPTAKKAKKRKPKSP